MKNFKQCTLTVLLAFLVFAFIACGDDNNCKCFETYGEWTHLEEGENCGCNKNNCNCQTKVNTTLTGTSIKVIKEPGVLLLDFNSMVGTFNDFLVTGVWWSTGQIANFKANITEIRVNSGTAVSHNGDVLTVGSTATTVTIMLYLAGKGLDTNNPIE